jgi:hypothetical protein
MIFRDNIAKRIDRAGRDGGWGRDYASRLVAIR